MPPVAYNATHMGQVGINKEHEYYRLTTAETLRSVQSKESGLTSHQAVERLRHSGANVLNIDHSEPKVFTLFRQFKDMMILLLLASALLSQYLGDSRTAIVLLAIVFFNVAIGFLQEFKAEKLVDSLKKLVITKARVIRDGKEIQKASAELVVGDIVYIEAGDNIPADLRLLSEKELSTNDFALTGESNPTRKVTQAIHAHQPIAGRQNLLFMGTTVATGEGYGIVIATGMHTELGRIASLSQRTSTSLSPLQRETNNIATRVTQGTIVLCLVLLPIAIYGGLGYKDAFLFAIGFAASIIPQGLPAEINTALAQAASKLARARALVKKLSAVETLGATNVILTDKTGTLTKNQMTAEELLIGRTSYLVTGTGYEATGALTHHDKTSLKPKELADIRIFFETAAFASNALVNPPDDEHAEWHVVGDPTEGALITLARKAGIDPVALSETHHEDREYAFDSGRKRMSSVRKYNGKKYLFVKGAPEAIMEVSTKLWDHTLTRKFTAHDKKRLLAHHETHAAQAQRNLALAYRILPDNFDISKHTHEDAEKELVFLGMVSMIDPVREEVPAAMVAAHGAHMSISIVTGDSALTARAVAVKAKLAAKPEDLTVVSSEELDTMDSTDVLRLLRNGKTIFSRVSPEDKLRIVEIAEEAGLVVAVTGDGINDAPALRRANIGVAMGVAGTDVAKQSADVILLDDSFHTLVGAVQQGRTVFKNIQKGTLSAFTSNGAELVVNLVSLVALTAFHIPLAISVLQILAIDLIAELFPIAALGRDKAEGNLMREKPRDLRSHILNRDSLRDLAGAGLLIGGLAFLNYLFYYWRNGISAVNIDAQSFVHAQAMTLTYLTIVLAQLANILQRRSEHGLFTRYQLHNKTLWGAYALSLTLVGLIIYSPLNTYFNSAPLGIVDWLYAIAAAVIFVSVREFHIRTHHHSRKNLFANNGIDVIRKHLKAI